jgi:hypothetical protein
LGLGFVVFLLLGIAPLAVVHDPADRGPRLGRNFHEVETSLGGPSLGVGGFDDSDLLIVLVDQADRRDTNLLVATKVLSDLANPFES